MPAEQAKAAAKPHSVSLENRERLSLSGVEDVSGFDENSVVLTTALGALTVRGEELHIDRIDLDLGQLELKGHICSLSYDEIDERSSFFSRLFG